MIRGFSGAWLNQTTKVRKKANHERCSARIFWSLMFRTFTEAVDNVFLLRVDYIGAFFITDRSAKAIFMPQMR